ncbi:tRNA (adenosine(37)-N6)-threonylcarbamoyltransferase complex dimerization subunit type 1 TsaB [candidate division KSB1 bacterium]
MADNNIYRPVNILGIDTSSQICSVGIISGKPAAVEKKEKEESRFTESLIPLIEDTLREARLDIGSIDRIAVCIGPGSFTGLRVGVGCAKGLAHSLNRPLVGVTAFEALYMSGMTNGFPLCLIVPFKGDKISYVFCENVESLQLKTEGRAGSWKDLLPLFSEVKSVAGNFTDDQISLIREAAPDSCEVQNVVFSGKDIAEIGFKQYGVGAGEDPALIEPLYAHSIEFRKKHSKLIR